MYFNMIKIFSLISSIGYISSCFSLNNIEWRQNILRKVTQKFTFYKIEIRYGKFDVSKSLGIDENGV